MKNRLISLCIALVGSVAFICNCDAKGIQVSPAIGNDPVAAPATINNLDSVYFDISQAIFNGNSVEFPVYFKSDDVVNAIGFAFTFDEAVLEYDTIIIVANYFDSPIFSYNQQDSVVRFETFSILQPIVNDTVLVKVRFNVLAGQMCDTQIDSTWTSLNGDVCSYSVVGCETIGLADNELDNSISIYPNPAADMLYVEATEITLVELFDSNGRKVWEQNIDSSKSKTAIQTSSFQPGIYVMKVSNQEAAAMKKIMIMN
ncbi:MAG: T9SS type A sorting domain-containing protein [Bacteroidetes bacterium]|nr:T9SS type A sorting domain-containing protein [Bacteroidota bacterium]